VREDALQVYLRHRDALFNAIIKSSDYQEEALEYSNSLVNLQNHDMDVPVSWADKVCVDVIMKIDEEEEKASKKWEQMMRDNPFREKQQDWDASDSKRARKKRKQAFAEDEGKGALFSRIAAAEEGKHVFSAEPGIRGGQYTTAVHHYDLASLWPELAVGAPLNGLHFFHPSVHPLRKKDASNGLPVFATMLAGRVWKDDWDNGTSIAEREAALDEALERGNIQSPMFAGMKTAFSTKRKDEMEKLEEETKKKHGDDKSFSDLDEEEQARMTAKHTERDHNMLGSLLSGPQGHHHEHLLYERDYNRWHGNQDEDVKSLSESDKRAMHMFERQKGWASGDWEDHLMDLDDLPEETVSQQIAKQEAIDQMNQYSWDTFGIPNYTDLDQEKQLEVRKERLGTKRFSHDLGWLGLNLGLQWLNPKERSQVVEHLLKKGANHNDHQVIELEDKTKIPMGHFVRNFLTNVMQEYKMTQRGHTKLSPNLPKYPEKETDIGSRAADERGATHNALMSVAPDKFENFMGEMLGFPLEVKSKDGKTVSTRNFKGRKVPLVGLRDSKHFQSRIKHHAKEGGQPDEDGNPTGHDFPIWAAMREARDAIQSKLKNSRGPTSRVEDDFHLQDLLDLTGWEIDREGNLVESEQHKLFDNWEPEGPHNLSKEEMEEIMDARNSYLGFARDEKPNRDIISHYLTGHNGPESENEFYHVDADGHARGRGDHIGAFFEGGGYPMLNNHYLEAIASMLTPDSLNYDKSHPQYFPAQGLFGTIDSSGNVQIAPDMMRLLAPIVKEAMNVNDRSAQNLVNAFSIHESTAPNDQFSIRRGKKSPRNNKNWFADTVYTHLGGITRKLRDFFASGRDKSEIETGVVNGIEGASHAINPVQRNDSFGESIGANIGLRTDDYSGDQKLRSHEHEYYRDTTLRGAMHRPGQRFSKDSNGVWRPDPNGQMFLGSPYDIHGKNRSTINNVASEHRTAYRDSDVDWLSMMDNDSIYSQMPDNLILRTPQNPDAPFWTLGDLKWAIENKRFPTDDKGEVMSREDLEGELLDVMRRFKNKENFLQLKPGMKKDQLKIGEDGKWDFENIGSAPFEVRNKPRKDHEKRGQHYDMMKSSIAAAVEEFARDYVMPLYLEADPDAFDVSDWQKFVSNHSQMLADAERMLMHLPHDSHGITVTAPDLVDFTKKSVEEKLGSSPHRPIASIIGHVNVAGEERGGHFGSSVHPTMSVEEIMEKLGLDENNEDDKAIATQLLESLNEMPGEAWNMRAMTVGQLLQKEGELGIDWQGDFDYRGKTNAVPKGHDWNVPSSPSEILDDHMGEFSDRMEEKYRDRVAELGGNTRTSDLISSRNITDFSSQPVFQSINNLYNLMANPQYAEDLEHYGLSFHSPTIPDVSRKRANTHVNRGKSILNSIILHSPVDHDHEAADESGIHAGFYKDVELHPPRARDGVHVIPYHSSTAIGVKEGAIQQPSVSMSLVATSGQAGFSASKGNVERPLPFASHDSYANIHGEDVSQQLMTGMESGEMPETWGQQGLNQKESMFDEALSSRDPSLAIKTRPTTISGLLLKDDLPKEMPLIDPMHKIFDIKDLDQLRGFTGEWVVSVFYEGQRIKVKRRKNSLTITNDEHETVGVSVDMKKALRKLCKHNYTIDCVLSGDELYVNDLMDYDGNDVTDMTTRERVKVLRGQFDSHESVIVPSPSTLKITDETGLETAVKSLLEDNKDAKLLLRDAKSSYMKGEEKHPKWILMTKSDDDFHVPFGMEMDGNYFILHFEEDLVKYEIIDDSPVNPVSAMAALNDSDYPVLLAKSLEVYWRPVFDQMLKEGKPLQEPMSDDDVEEESAGIIKPKDEDRIKKPKKYLSALLRLEKRLDDFEKGHYPMSGGKGMYFDVESPRGPTELVHPSALPDYDMLEPDGQELEQEEDYPGKRRKAAEVDKYEEELESFGNP